VSLDWGTQVIVPISSAAIGGVIGAGATLFASKRQIKADAASVQVQFANERTARDQEKEAQRVERARELTGEIADSLVAGRQEARINVQTLRRPGAMIGYPRMTTEFLRQVIQAGRIIGTSDVAILTRALVVAERYNAAVTIEVSGTPVHAQAMQDLAETVVSAMAQVEQMLSRHADTVVRQLQDESDWLHGSTTRTPEQS
jgi:hypothetical protein